MTIELTENIIARANRDPAEFTKIMQSTEAAKNRYAIFFTPRSGSSWLTDELSKTKVLGRPEEYLNPNFVPNIAEKMHGRTCDDYLKALLRKRKTSNGVFGLELTFFHYQLFDKAVFAKWFPFDKPTFFLFREDIVLQAISLYKAVSTQVFHNRGQGDASIGQSSDFAEYDGQAIMEWLSHIRRQEVGCVQLLERENANVTYLSYEALFNVYDNVPRLFAEELGFGLEFCAGLTAGQSAHQKIGGSTNNAMKEHFISEHAAEIDALNADRTGLIGRVRK